MSSFPGLFSPEPFSDKMFTMVEAITEVTLLGDFLPGDKCHHRTVALLQLLQHQVLEEILPELFVLKKRDGFKEVFKTFKDFNA